MAAWTSRVEREERERSVISCYPELLAEKIAECGREIRPRNLHRCRSPACPTCRKLRGRKEGRRAIKFMAGAANHDLLLLTVAVGVVRDLWQVAGANQKFTFDSRNLVRAARQDWPRRWGGFRLYGWPEVDVISSNDMPFMPDKLRNYVTSFKPDWNDDGVAYMPHWHLLVDGAGLDRQEVGAAFMDQWRVDGAVDVRPFHPNRSVDENIAAIAKYSHAYKIGKMWDGVAMNWWPTRPTADMYSIISMNRWTGKRFMINPVNSDVPRASTSCVSGDDGYEPMAWLV